MKLIFSSALVVALFGFASQDVRAENWPSWRGPTGNGISSAKHLPTEFGPDKNVLWKVKLPGSAGATPVVWGERIFLTAVVGDELRLLCFSTAGEELWNHVVSTGNKDSRGDEGNSASPSPSTDGKHVWTMMGDGSLACCTVDGKLVWKIDLQERYGKFNIAFGMTSTPVLKDGRLYLQLIHGAQDEVPSRGIVACVDGVTGDGIWKQIRETDGTHENKHSYASPIIYDYADIKYLLTHGADYCIAHDLESGKELWRCGDLNVDLNVNEPRYDKTLRFVASPACAEGIIVIPTAKRGPAKAIGPNGKGDISKSKTDHMWAYARTPDVPSPLIVGGLVYLNMADGNLSCLDQATGEEYYYERTHRQRHRASPVYANGYLYLTARDGVISVVKAGKKFEMVAQNELGESMSASPVIANETMYLRTFDSLWAIRQGGDF